MRGISQQKLAEQLGLKRNNIASYEAGIVEPKAINFLKLALFFDMPPGDLLEKNLSESFMSTGTEEFPKVSEGEIDLLRLLRRFSGHTSDMQKVLEGFREFQKLIFSTSSSGEQEVAGNNPTGTNGELDTLLDIMEQLLDSNWKLIGTMTKESNG